MANTIGPITLPRPSDDILDATDGYGAGALLHLESSATSGGVYADVATETIVSGTEAYYFRDAAGSDTTWYRTYLTTGAGSQPSDHSPAAGFQAGSGDTYAYTTLERVKSHAGIDDQEDDSRLPFYVAAVNAEINRRIGVFVGPSSDTSRVYDGLDYAGWGRRLWIPGGIRTLTALTVAASTGDTQTAATSGDWQLGPHRSYLVPGQPYSYVEFRDVVTGAWRYFPPGYANVTLTGTFGYAAVPDDLAKLADMLALRMWADRNAGPLSAPTPSKFIYPDDAGMLEWYRRVLFPARP